MSEVQAQLLLKKAGVPRYQEFSIPGSLWPEREKYLTRTILKGYCYLTCLLTDKPTVEMATELCKGNPYMLASSTADQEVTAIAIGSGNLAELKSLAINRLAQLHSAGQIETRRWRVVERSIADIRWPYETLTQADAIKCLDSGSYKLE